MLQLEPHVIRRYKHLCTPPPRLDHIGGDDDGRTPQRSPLGWKQVILRRVQMTFWHLHYRTEACTCMGREGSQ